MTEQSAIVPRQPYTPPEVTCVAFRQEQGYTVSEPQVEQLQHFQLIMYADGQQEQHNIEQMQYHSTWSADGNHFFN